MVQINIPDYELIIIMAAISNNYVGCYNLDGKFIIINPSAGFPDDDQKGSSGLSDTSSGKVSFPYHRSELIRIATELGLKIPSGPNAVLVKLLEQHIPTMASPGPWSMKPFHI